MTNKPHKPRNYRSEDPKDRAVRLDLREKLDAAAQDIFDLYVAGKTWDEIAAGLPFEIQPWRLRHMLVEGASTRAMFFQANAIRAHNLVEETLAMARQAAMLGDASGLKISIDTLMKLAAKFAPQHYGDTAKVEVSGPGGGPIKLVALTDEELLEIASRGKEQ